MRLAKSTRYALAAALDMTEEWESGRLVTAAHVAVRHGAPEDVVAKVFQQLVRAGIAHGTRGRRGGYRLASKPRDVTVLDVMRVFEPSSIASRAPGESVGDPRLNRLFDEVDELVSSTFASITLATLAGLRARADPGSVRDRRVTVSREARNVGAGTSASSSEPTQR